jgi:hypothetical protein
LLAVLDLRSPHLHEPDCKCTCTSGTAALRVGAHMVRERLFVQNLASTQEYQAVVVGTTSTVRIQSLTGLRLCARVRLVTAYH